MIKNLKFKKFVLYCIVLNGLFHATTIQAQMRPRLPLPTSIPKRENVDSGNIRIWYALNALNIKDPKTYDDFQCLEIGEKMSRYYSYFAYHSDSTYIDFIRKNPRAQGAPVRNLRGKVNYWSEYIFSEYVKNFSTNLFTEYTRMPHGIQGNYYYIEAIPAQQWKIQDSTLSIAGFHCQKATCNFNGRIFTAWFTTEVPIRNGPWKFGGLPGLIIKVYDHNKLYTFELVAIENTKSKFLVSIINDDRFIKTDRTKLLKLQLDVNVNYYKASGAQPVNPSPNWTPPTDIVYHPLELK